MVNLRGELWNEGNDGDSFMFVGVVLRILFERWVVYYEWMKKGLVLGFGFVFVK